MDSWRSCNIQIAEEAALDTSKAVMQSDVPHPDDEDQPSRTWFDISSTERGKPKNDSIIGESQHQNESCSSFHNQSYILIKEFQFYIDMVKRFTRPGCSPETLDVALSSMSSLADTLSDMSSKQHSIRASL